MKRARLKQFIISLLIILSLFASSAAACACSHHEKKTEASVPSCHKHSKQKKENRDASIESATSEIECVCVQFVSKISAKSSNVKFEKQVAAALVKTKLKITFVSRTIPANIAFSKPLYLSDSFYNLAPGRAPPVL